MGLHRRLFQSSLSTKFRYKNIVSINPFKHIIRFYHDIYSNTSKNPNKMFLVKRLHGIKNANVDNVTDPYLSLLSTNGRRVSLEKNFYFRSPQCPFAVIGNNHNNNKNNSNNTLISEHEIFKPLYSFRIISSCDGLICLQSINGSENNVLLWNPSINDFNVVDYSSIKCRPRSAPCTSFRCAGFGFDHDSKEYKLIMQVRSFYRDKQRRYDRSEYDYEVCSLKTGTWLPIRTPKVVPSFSSWSSVYIDGFCYCTAYDSTGDFILSFDFANEEFSFFPVPEKAKLGELRSYNYILVEYEGLLGFVLYQVLGAANKELELWVRERDESWSRVSSLRVPNMDKPLAYWEKDKWFFVRKGELSLIDLTTKDVEPLDIYGFPGAYYDLLGGMEMIPFVESTIPPNGEVR